MKAITIVTAVLATSLAASVASAQTTNASAAPQAVDPASIQALKEMGAYLQSLSRFRVATVLSGERVLADGQKLQHMASATLDAERPNRLRAHMWSARSDRELVYDGKTFTIFVPAQKYYSSVDFADSNAGLVSRLEDRFGVEIPLSDLFKWGTPAAPVDKIESAMNAGQDLIGGEVCNHYAFRQGSFDWQIWIAAGAKPLPRRLVIVNRADEARPQSVSMLDWDLKPAFNEATFRFTPPKGATRIEIVPLKTAK